jgi:hypothetical protein
MSVGANLSVSANHCRTWLIIFSSALCLLIAACTSASHTRIDFNPQIKATGVDMHQYEKDRQSCEKEALDHPSKMESNIHFNFRKCLIDKGYALLS